MIKNLFLSVLIFIFSGFQIVYSQANAGPDQEICTDSTYMQANDSGPNSGLWTVISGSGTFTDPTFYNTLVTDIDPGINIYRWQVNTESDEVTITNNEVRAEAGSDQIICTGYTTLNAVSPSTMYPFQGTGHWTNMSGNGAIIANSFDENTEITGLPIGYTIFRWTVELGSCSAYDHVQIINSSVTAIATDIVGCTGDFILNGNDPSQFGGIGLWKVISGSGVLTDPNLFNTSFTGVPNGETTTLSWMVSNGICSDSIIITVTNNDFIISAGPDVTVCSDSITLFGDDPGPGFGIWTLIEGSGIIEISNFNTTTVYNLDQGANIFIWTVTRNGCTNSDTVIITNNLPDDAIILNPQNDTIILQDFLQLTVVEPVIGNGIWSVASPEVTFDDVTNYTTMVNNIPIGDNVFIWSVTNGICPTSEDFITITRNELIAEAGQDLYLPYYATSTQLDAFLPEGASGIWSVIEGEAVIENPTDPNSIVSNLSSGDNILRWTISFAKNSSYDEVIITILTDTVYAGPDQEICTDSTYMQAANPYPYMGFWTKIGGAGIIENLTLYNTKVTNLSVGVNVFRWTVTIDEEEFYDYVMITNNTVFVSAGVNQILCTDYIELSGIEDGVWTYLSGCGSITENTTTNMWEVDLCQGENELELTITRNGCSNSDTIIITNNSPTQAIADDDAEICTTEYILTGNEPGVGETGLWTNEFGAQGTIDNPTNNVTTVYEIGAGANTFRWTVSNAFCSTYDDIVITNNSISGDVGLDRQICTDSTFLGAADAGVWELIDGCATFSDTVDNMIYLTNICLGDNVFTCTFTNGICEAVDTLIITNNSVYSYTGEDIIVCTDYATLFANPLEEDETGLWTIVTGFGNIIEPTNNITQVTDLSYQENIFRWTVTNGYCSSSSEIMVFNNYPDSIFLPDAGEDQVICDDYTILEANELLPGWEGYWSVAGGMAVIVSPTNTITEVYNLSSGINCFKWTILLPGYCSYYDYVMITNNSFDAYAGEDQIICIDTAKMNAHYEPGATLQEWLVLAGGGVFDNVSDPETVVRNISLGANIYRWHITKDGCSSYDDVMIIYDYLFASAGDDASLCEDYYQMNAEHPEGTTGIWTVIGTGGGTIENNTAWNTNITDMQPGTNLFEWHVYNEYCSSRDTVALTYNLPPIAQFEADLEEFTAPQEVIFTNTSGYWPGWTEPDEFSWNINDVYFETTYNINEVVTYTFTNIGETDSIYYISLIAEDYQTACTDTFTSSVTAHPQEESIYDLNSNFKVYPNPTNSLITVSSSIDLSGAIFEFTDISGQKVPYSFINETTNAFSIDLSNLAKGMYFLMIRIKGQTKMLRLVKK
ncbi:MAG: T9SS type A sorting domain-containing protein [Bacteroidales bacterium]|nr:T9SS type A sorting domain-containing protein [Bacteroidales bacterium]